MFNVLLVRFKTSHVEGHNSPQVGVWGAIIKLPCDGARHIVVGCSHGATPITESLPGFDWSLSLF